MPGLSYLCRLVHRPNLAAEMAVTDMILAKIYRFYQLLNHSHGFFAKV
jgi:hypothetical protein